MRANGNKVYCALCKKYISMHTEVYLPNGSEDEGMVVCLYDNCVVGYTHDPEWKNKFDKR